MCRFKWVNTNFCVKIFRIKAMLIVWVMEVCKNTLKKDFTPKRSLQSNKCLDSKWHLLWIFICYFQFLMLKLVIQQNINEILYSSFKKEEIQKLLTFGILSRYNRYLTSLCKNACNPGLFK